MNTALILLVVIIGYGIAEGAVVPLIGSIASTKVISSTTSLLCPPTYKKVACRPESVDKKYRTLLFKDTLVKAGFILKKNDKFVNKMTCMCDIAARYKGFSYFSISSYGECYGLTQLGKTTAKGNGCVNKAGEACNFAAENNDCVGKNNDGAVYKTTVTGHVDFCSRSYQMIACQNEDMDRTMLLNDRLYWTPNVWNDYNHFINKLICMCNIAARNAGFDHFTISFYGQCAGIKNFGQKSLSKGCMNGYYQNCALSDVECVGKANADAVYVTGHPKYTSKSTW